MISFSQNFEDVILERIFKEQKTGFYIDVGAWEETIDSVTKHFYEKGWCGINVEPLPIYYAKYQESRQRDINLNIAVLEKPGATTLYEIPGTGLSTLDQLQSEAHRSKGLEVCERTVDVSTLEAICSTYVVDRVIDFIKIDSEGTELSVLQGGNWERFRPRVLLIEALEPNSKEPAYALWEPFLLENRYIFAYFDGLNRFYVREEEADLLRHFNAPPNVFDSFVTYRTVLAERKADELETRLASAMEKADILDKICKSPLGRMLYLLFWKPS